MDSSKWQVTIALLALTATAQAHTHLLATVPADGSVVAEAPANISLTFSEPTHVTALALVHAGGKPQELTPLPRQAAKQLKLPIPQLEPGEYEIVWRGMSDDGHVMGSKLRFTVSPKAMTTSPMSPHKP